MDTSPDAVHVKFGSTKIADMVNEHLGRKEKGHVIGYLESELSVPFQTLRKYF